MSNHCGDYMFEFVWALRAEASGNSRKDGASHTRLLLSHEARGPNLTRNRLCEACFLGDRNTMQNKEQQSSTVRT